MKIKPQVVIILFVIFWGIFILWGIFKTAGRLSQPEQKAKQPVFLVKEKPGLGSKVGQVEPAEEFEEFEEFEQEEMDLSEMPPFEDTELEEEFAEEEMLESEEPLVAEIDELDQEFDEEFLSEELGMLTDEEEAAAAAAAAPTLVRTFEVKRTDFSDLLPVMGVVKGDTEIELRFEVNGIIQSINFREGEKVKKNDVVATLNSNDAQLKLEYAQSKFAATRASYQANLKKLEIHQQLYSAGAIIKSKLEEVELECESIKYQTETAQVEQDLARNELEKTRLLAPIDGIMGPREAEVGEFVIPQDQVASVLGTDDVLIEVGIVERDINKIKLGQKARVFVDAYADIPFEGLVDNIFPVVEGRSRTLTAKIKVNNPEGKLLPGMFSRADISLIDLEDAFIVPKISLIPTGQQRALVPVIPQEVIMEEEGVSLGTVQLRQVTLGYTTSDYVQITAGVNEGDLVVTEAQGEIKDNTDVRITTIDHLP